MNLKADSCDKTPFKGVLHSWTLKKKIKPPEYSTVKVNLENAQGNVVSIFRSSVNIRFESSIRSGEILNLTFDSPLSEECTSKKKAEHLVAEIAIRALEVCIM